MDKWLTTAKRVDTIEVEISFLLSRGFEEEKGKPWPFLATRPNAPSMVRTSEIESNVEGLGRYYAAVINWAKQKNLPFSQLKQHFWMRLYFWNAEKEIIFCFPWYDTFSEMEYFFDAVETGEEGELFNDVDQGWRFIVFKAKDELILLQWDDEDPGDAEPQVMVRVCHQMFRQEVRQLRERTKRIIEQLTAAIGHDCWTRYSEWPELNAASLPHTHVTVTVKKLSWWQNLW